MKALTVLIPAFNEENTITRCIDSILCQKIDGLEIVVLDDGSTDGTVNVVKSHPSFQEKIKVIESNIHIGAQLNLLRGALCVNTEFTLFMSANDILVENSLQNLLCYMLENNNCVASYGRSMKINDNGEVVGDVPAHFYVNARSSVWQERCLSVATQYVWGGVQYALYRTKSLQISYPHEVRYGADHLFYFLLASTGEIHFLENLPMRLEREALPDQNLS